MSNDPQYRSGEVDGVSEIPDGWTVAPLSDIATCNDKSLGEQHDPEKTIRYVDISSVSEADGIGAATEMAFGEAPSRARRLAKKGDVVVSTVRTYLRAISAVSEAHQDCVFSTGFAVLSPRDKEINQSFLKWALSSDSFISLVEANSKGISYPAINSSELMKIKVILPPRQQQTAIAAFLDHHTSLIDQERALITAKIEALREKRKALIFECVTGKRTIVEAEMLAGLNDWSDVVGTGPYIAIRTPGKDDKFTKAGKLVDSGVEWIGDIPEGWWVARLKDVATNIENGLGLAGSDNNEKDPRYVRITDIKGLFELKPEDDCYASQPQSIAMKARLSQGDILLASVGASVGKAYCHNNPNGEACFAGFLTRATPKNIDSRYLAYWADSYTLMDQVHSGIVKSTIENFSAGKYKNTLLPVPPKNEQKKIASFLDHHTTLIDQEIETLTTKNSLLADKRKALIFEAVTGKLDIQ